MATSRQAATATSRQAATSREAAIATSRQPSTVTPRQGATSRQAATATSRQSATSRNAAIATSRQPATMNVWELCIICKRVGRGGGERGEGKSQEQPEVEARMGGKLSLAPLRRQIQPSREYRRNRLQPSQMTVWNQQTNHASN